MSQPLESSLPTPATTSQKPQRIWLVLRRWVLRRLLATAVVLMLYVLSIGPMWWVWYSGMYVDTEANYWVIAIYEPLRQLCRFEWVNSVITSYIEWWNL